MSFDLSPALPDRGGFTPSINPPRQPQRLQRSRKRGWRAPEGSRYVGRPTIFGNPFMLARFGHAKSVQLFDRWLEGSIADLTLERMGFCPAEVEAMRRRRTLLLERLPDLKGLDLICWCPLSSRWCHANPLIVRANPVGWRQ